MRREVSAADGKGRQLELPLASKVRAVENYQLVVRRSLSGVSTTFFDEQDLA